MGNTVGSYVELTPSELRVIIGTILGDGHLEALTSGSVRLAIAHGLQQRSYVDMLYTRLRRFVITPPKTMWFYDRRFSEKRPS